MRLPLAKRKKSNTTKHTATGDLDRGAFVEQKAALAIRIEHLQGERTEIELKRQAQRTQIEARESAKRELSQYLYATHLDGALLTESMYQAIDRVKVFSNERIEIRWKFGRPVCGTRLPRKESCMRVALYIRIANDNTGMRFRIKSRN